MSPQQAQRGTLNVFPSYKGGCTVLVGGYVYELVPDHPHCNPWGYVAQHRLVAEEALGRILGSGELVHHRDEDRRNNQPGNLEVLTRSQHLIRHRAGQRKYALTEEAVREALRETGGLKKACALLQTTPDTIRRHYPDLLLPYRRKSPTKIDDPKIVETIGRLAPDPTVGYREIAREHGISMATVVRLCERNGIAWVSKRRTKESYPGRPKNSATR